MKYVNCYWCKTPLDEDAPGVYKRISAWETRSGSSSRRGGSDVVLRGPAEKPEFACGGCVALLKRGISVGQEQML